MEKVISIESRTAETKFGMFAEKTDEYLTIPGDMSIIDAAKEFKCSEKLLTALIGYLDYLRDNIDEDLRDIYKKVEAIK